MPLPLADKVFKDFLNEKDKEKSAKILGELVNEHIIPLIKPILIRSLQKRSNYQDQAILDAEDLSSEIVTSFVERFDNGNKKAPPNIENFESYFTTVAKKQIQEFWRRKNPNWCSLKHKIQYLFDEKNKYKPKEFVFLKEAKLYLLKNCGVAKTPFSTEEISEIIKNKNLINPQTELVEAVTAILKEAKGGLLLSEITNLIFELQTIKPDMDETPLEETIHKIADKTFGDNEQLRLEARVKLGKIWLEIKELPFNQRFALLLQMQEKGFSGVHLLIFLQVVKLKELAESLEMSVSDFAELYNDLPLSDNQIAVLLTAKLQTAQEITAKQAANLRKVARERLQRKVKFFDE